MEINSERVRGRNKDRETIVRFLTENRSKTAVVTISGIGGIGKTTLARLVCKDEKVQSHFHPSLWANARHAFHLNTIIEDLLELDHDRRGILSIDDLQKRLKRRIEGQTCLLVLDDVGKLAPEQCQELRDLFKVGIAGVLIATVEDQDIDLVNKDKTELSKKTTPTHMKIKKKEGSRIVKWGEEVGAEKEKKTIKAFVLKESKDKLSTLFIGLRSMDGEIDPVRSICDDKDVKDKFDFSPWVPIPGKEFNLKRIVRGILDEGEQGKTLEQLQIELQKKLLEKERFLIGLDVHCMNAYQCDELEVLMMKNGKVGNKLLITTRDKQVQHMKKHLGSLSSDDSLNLFVKNAEFDETRREIVEGCRGVPLLLRIFGGILSHETDENKLKEIQEKIKNSKPFDVSEILKLSFDTLPPHIKKCFLYSTYCTLHPPERGRLTQQWIALDLVEGSENNQKMEDLAREYFDELLSRSFFYNLVEDNLMAEARFEVHDIVYKLAHKLSEGEYCMTSSDQIEKIDSTVLHLVFTNKSKKFPSLKKLRTVKFEIGLSSATSGTKLDMAHVDSLSSSLRVLDLSGSEFEELPNSIGELKDLRYLDVSYNIYLDKLPNSLFDLSNLETLRFEECGILELPRDFSKLKKLRNLYACTEQVSIREEVICGLASLRILHLNPVPNLETLPKCLEILTNLETLVLKFCLQLTLSDTDIKGLKRLRNLTITHNHKESLFPFPPLRKDVAAASFSSLSSLCLSYCMELKILPEWLVEQQYLRRLHVEFCPNLSPSPEEKIFLTNCLEYLSIHGCPELIKICESEDWQQKNKGIREIHLDGKIIRSISVSDTRSSDATSPSSVHVEKDGRDKGIPNSEDVTTIDSGTFSSTTAPGSATYEVFLSFNGVDTRKIFTDHLYSILTGAGIRTFRDEQELRVGKEIRSDLLKAMEESSISIPIFSKGYASSKWCLREVTHMVKRMNDRDPEGRRRHTVCPIFYDVTPEEVKRQAGSFAEAFKKHANDEKLDPSTVEEWMDALKEVCELKGWEKDKFADGHEGQLVDKIVTEVCKMLKKRNVHLTGDLIGMDHHWEEMTKLLDICSGDGARIVGIIGMGGIGKTTIAKYTHNQLCGQFQPHCTFLEDVRERVKRNKGCAELQQKLISDVLKRSADKTTLDIRNAFIRKKVLIVLDDVENKSQLKDIIGRREYFGSGSTIIVTTRNKEVFEEWNGDLIYEPSVMDPDDSLLLFCKYAFLSTQPREGYEVISREIVKTAAGLPLSLVVTGSMLFSKEIKVWETTLKKLKFMLPVHVYESLKISYDALHSNQQQMFLDIACHFIGEDKTHAIHMWEDCGFFPESVIDDLISLSLITIRDDNVLRMHNQLRNLGRYIVYLENPSDPGQRSRLWYREDVLEVLRSQSGTKKVETLSVNYRWDSDRILSNDDFKGLSSLRYLSLEGPRLEGDFKGLLSNLRWFKCRILNHLGKMPITNFHADKLVILDLSESDISDGWESFIQIKVATNLKVLNLYSCRYLTKLPECLWNMKSLVELDLSFTKIEELPEQRIGNLTNLTKLHLIGTKIERLPDAIGKLKKIQVLKSNACPSLRGELPRGIGRLSSLRVLDLFGTKITGGLPKDISGLSNLETLNFGRCEELQLPVEGLILPHSLTKLSIPLTESSLNGVKGLVNLRYLEFHKNVGCCCERVAEEVVGAEMPSNLTDLSLVELDDHVMSCRLLLPAMKFDSSSDLNHLDISWCTFRTLPICSLNLSNCQRLKELSITHCFKMREIKALEVLTSLEVLTINYCFLLMQPDLSNCQMIKKLEIYHCEGMREIKGLGVLTSLEKLTVKDCPLLTQTDLSNCQMLKKLEIESCKELREIKGLEVVTSLEELKVKECPFMMQPDLSKCEMLKIIHMQYCREMTEIKGLRVLTSLEELRVYGCHLLMQTDLSYCQMLKELHIENCQKMREIEGLGVLSSLEGLIVQFCHSLMQLDLSNCHMLRRLHIHRCVQMREIKGIEGLSSLEELGVSDCPLLIQPDLLNLKSLKIVRWDGIYVFGGSDESDESDESE